MLRFSPAKLLPFLLFLLLPALAAATDFISLKEIEPGMKGYGLTVFAGTRVDTFAVEVVGVQQGVRADGSLILIEVGGHGLEKSSIAQGMSGSPVFIEGRFAGALAFGWGGALRPLAGVTPAAEILALPTDISHTAAAQGLSSRPGSGPARYSLRSLVSERAATSLAEEVLGKTEAHELSKEIDLAEGWPSAELLAKQLLADFSQPGGLDGENVSQRWFINPVGFQAGAVNGSAGNPGGEFSPLVPGSACAVPLITGDAQLGAIGTVTWVDGENVFMMGHPFMQRGPVDLPLATARIHTIFPSREISFKLGSVGEIVGTVHHDQRAGLSGRLGKEPDLVPVDLQLRLGSGSDSVQKYSFAVVDDPQLTPPLVFWALYNSLLVLGDDASAQNLTYDITLNWKKEGSSEPSPLKLTGVTSGPGGVGALARDWMAPMNILLNNPFARARLTSVEAELATSRPVASATVSGLVAPRSWQADSGMLACRVELSPWQGDREFFDLDLALPGNLKPGNYRLAVASAAEIFALEAQRAPGSFQVAGLDQMLELLGSERSANTLVAVLMAPGRAVMVGSREMKGLPGRVSRLIRRGNMEARPVMADLIARTDTKTPWMLQGHAVRNIKLTRRDEPAQQERRP